jgi:hypothetical protein
MINIGSIDEEILKKGLEHSELLYLNSMPSTSADLKDDGVGALGLDYSAFFKNQTMPHDLDSDDNEDSVESVSQ